MDQMLRGQDIGRRQKIRRIEVLLAVVRAAPGQEWFEGKFPPNDPHREDRGQATRDLLEIGLIFYQGPGHPQPYRLTPLGKTFLDGVMKKIGKGNSVNWSRVREIEFPTLQRPAFVDDV